MILLLDHDDSFVHVLADYLRQLGRVTEVVRDTALTLDDVRGMAPAGIVLSPGPGHPRECALALEVVRSLGATVPILGVCLGHQAIATALGGTVARAAHPRHGRTSSVTHDGHGVFRGLPSPLDAMRYHSLAVDATTLPDTLVVSATADDGTVMGIRHRTWPVEGVQFHPESILTTQGMAMVRNWVKSEE
ncbi:MAG TPA: aminodeoxychorismate/anthranilate synthase component II [Gemmatimonadales bacterium]|nr:aminodeoxychorismate/anthranilate synthase component II [Gemmatimonadales bacterium]